MEYLMMAINASWWWLGPIILATLVVLCAHQVWHLIRDEIDWWNE